LVQLALVHLSDRALRARRTTGPQPGAHAVVGPGPDALLAVHAHQRLPDHGVAGGFLPPRQLENARGARAADAIDAARAFARHHLALPGEGRPRDPPAVPDLTHALGVGDARPVEENLVEVDLAAHVAQRPHLDAGLVQVEQEVRDALALRRVGIGAGEEHGEVGPVRPGGPDLLARHDPLVAVVHRGGRQRRQVRASAGLAEELAPSLLVANDRRQEAAPLLL